VSNERKCLFCDLAIQPVVLPRTEYSQPVLRDAAAMMAGYCSSACQLAYAAAACYEGRAWWHVKPDCRCDGKHWVHDPETDLGIRTCDCFIAAGAAWAPEALYIQHAAVCSCNEVVCPRCGGEGYVSVDRGRAGGEHWTEEETCTLCAEVIQ